MLSNIEIFVLIVVGLGFAAHWIFRSLSRRSLEAQVMQALDGVQRVEDHYREVLARTNVPAYVAIKLTFLDIERSELNAMLNAIRAGEKVSYDRIYRLEKLVAEYIPGTPINSSAAPQ